jgi:nitric oxide dioxygenase
LDQNIAFRIDSGKSTMPLTPDQVKAIKATVPVVQEYGNAVTTLFYQNLLADAPILNNVFNKTSQVSGHQAKALAGALYAYAANIDNLGVLSPTVERICQKHAALFVQPAQYDIVGKYLLASMKDVLGDAMTPEIHDAWFAAYFQLAHLMQGREAQIYQENGDWKSWREFEIVKKIEESDEITSFYLSPVDRRPLPPFKPGQYISVQTTVPALKHLQSRQYSLSDAPNPDYYRISVKRDRGLDMQDPASARYPGYISNVLHDAKAPGDTLQVSHPAGDFFLAADSKAARPVVLLSAGVGVTPLASMLNDLSAKGSAKPISWIHATRSSRVQAFSSHVKSIAATHPNIRVTVFNKLPADGDVEGSDYHHVGRMDLAKLDQSKELFLHDPEAEYYLCGPEGFMRDMKNRLIELGVAVERIQLEVFGVPLL